MNTGNKWDQRYSEPGFAYGTDPNDFLVGSLHHLPSSGKVLCIAEGEGRNSVYLAKLGYNVTAVDSSAVAMEKTKAMAGESGVSVQTVVADLGSFDFGLNSYDAIVSIFCHLPPELRRTVHKRCAQGLTDGGIFLLEGYTPKQLKYGTGGPPEKELLMSLIDLKIELSGLEFLHSVEIEREIHEGRLHNGLGAVVQIIGRK